MTNEKVYKVQSYLVKFDMGNPVDINVSVYWENAIKLSNTEIINEAMGYIEELGINIVNDCDLFEIETIELL